MKEIKLTQDKVTLVDDEDFEYLKEWKWYAHKAPHTSYGKRGVYIGKGKTIRVLIHQAIMGKAPAGYEIDHKDGNGLNNQRDNLRFVTRRQNMQNRHQYQKYSRYPGVTFEKGRKKWQSYITIDGKSKFLGYYSIEKDAFNAYRHAVENMGQTMVAGIQ